MKALSLVVRGLLRAPLFAATAVTALGLGIGAATTVFSVADGTIFRPLQYANPDRLLAVHSTVRARNMLAWDVPYAEYQAWRDASRHLTGLAGFAFATEYTLDVAGDLSEWQAVMVTPGFLSTLGVPPALGRDFGAADFEPGAPRTMLIRDEAWRRVFHADANIVGRLVRIDGTPTTVVGVLPASFAVPTNSTWGLADALVPYDAAAAPSRRFRLVGRLAAGSGAADVVAELDPLAAARSSESGLRDTPIDGASAEPLSSALGGGSRRTLMLLLVGAVGALLLIGCANVANLLFARSTDRAGELALRSALGAGRGSLVGLLLLEVGVLAFAGGLVGVGLAYWAVGVVAPLVPAELSLLKPIAVDVRTMLFALTASVAAILVSGLLPALRTTRAGVLPALQQSSSRLTSAHSRTRQAIVGLEVALAVVLLVGGTLMTNGMIRLLRLDHGYSSGEVLAMRVALPRVAREAPRPSIDFVQRVLSAATRVPGVVSAGAMLGSPLARTMYGGVYRVDGFTAEWMREGAETGAGVCCTQSHRVSAGVFDVLGVPVRRGRGFTAGDATASPPVAIINERLARKFPPGLDPVGHWLANDRDPADRRLIVGVVADTRDLSLEFEPPQAIYLPIEERGAAAVTVFLATTGDARSVAGAAQLAFSDLAGPVVISDVMTLREMVLGSVSRHRLNAWLFGSFGVIGLLLAAVGIAGVVVYAVAHRTREIGVRLALGASPTSVRRLVTRQALVPVAIGLGVGLAGAFGLRRYVESLLFDVPPTDAASYAMVGVVLATVALAAAYLPARRAARIDPLLALRAE